MKKIAALSILLCLLAAGGIYFYFSGGEYVIRISEAQIREKLESKLPITKRYFLIIELTLNHPRVHLVNRTSRVLAGLDATLNIKLNDNPKPLGGTLDISSGVKYVTETGEFFLTDPVVENVNIEGIPVKFQSPVNGAISKILVEYFQKNPIYTLRASDLKRATVRRVLKSVIVENQELVITLGI